MKSITTQIEINCSPEQVWSVFTDFELYPEWNPFMKKVTGTPTLENKIEIQIALPNASEMNFKPVIKSIIPNYQFIWLGHFLIPGIIDGQHVFLFKNINNRTLFIQKEYFSGLFIPLIWSRLDISTRAGFNAMNNALKKRSEQLFH